MKKQFLLDAVNNSQKISYDPLRGHRIGDHEAGASWFDKDTLTAEDLIKSADWKEVKVPGSSDTVKVFQTAIPESIATGHYTMTDLSKFKSIIVEKGLHGNLEAHSKNSPEGATIECETQLATIIVVNEDNTWLAATAYPGEYEPLPNMDGLKDGQEISVDEALERGIRRVKIA